MAWWIYVLIAVAVILLITAAFLIRTAVLKKQGKYVFEQVSSKLKSFAGIRRYKVLTNVTLPYRDGVKNISHILIGIFGVLVVDAQEYSGSLYGTADAKEWTKVSKKGVRVNLHSPVLEIQEKVDAVRQAFAAYNIYKINIESINVVRNSPKGLLLYMPDTLPVIRVKRLGAFLSKSKYEKDLGVDMEKLADCIKKPAVLKNKTDK